MKEETTIPETGGAPNQFQARVREAAKRALNRDASVGPLELFQEMKLLQPVHVKAWRKGSEHYRVLEEHIQVGPAKYAKAVRYFHEWVAERDLRPIQASYTRRTPNGIQTLLVTAEGDPARENFYRTHYAPADMQEKKKARLAEKLAKAPDLAVFETVREHSQCTECETELLRGNLLFMERDNPICLACADLDHLVFLPSGDAALSRRARKHSPLSAIVIRFNRSRKRYERKGLLITEQALARAEEECTADAPKRAASRARAAIVRQEEDRQFIDEMSQAIRAEFPGCPEKETGQIAAHAGVRSSGRIGRSAAGRSLNRKALFLAVAAHVRHIHTEYDNLLMQGTDRGKARIQVRRKIDGVLEAWSKT